MKKSYDAPLRALKRSTHIKGDICMSISGKNNSIVDLDFNVTFGVISD